MEGGQVCCWEPEWKKWVGVLPEKMRELVAIEVDFGLKKRGLVLWSSGFDG